MLEIGFFFFFFNGLQLGSYAGFSFQAQSFGGVRDSRSLCPQFLAEDSTQTAPHPTRLPFSDAPAQTNSFLSAHSKQATWNFPTLLYVQTLLLAAGWTLRPPESNLSQTEGSFSLEPQLALTTKKYYQRPNATAKNTL